ncbi:MAG: hypothetical protein M3347_05315 [Armatimonadota bacterium]|nr:hypothetical protein [Armatimonadota bacterium]
MAGGTRDGSVLLWDLSRARKQYDIQSDVSLSAGAWVTTVAYAPDGKLAAGLNDGRVLVWAREPSQDAAPLWESEATRSAVRALSFSRDGRSLWSGDERGVLVARDAESGAMQSTLRLLPPREAGAALDWVRWDRAGQVTRAPDKP